MRAKGAGIARVSAGGDERDAVRGGARKDPSGRAGVGRGPVFAAPRAGEVRPTRA